MIGSNIGNSVGVWCSIKDGDFIVTNNNTGCVVYFELKDLGKLIDALTKLYYDLDLLQEQELK